MELYLIYILQLKSLLINGTMKLVLGRSRHESSLQNEVYNNILSRALQSLVGSCRSSRVHMLGQGSLTLLDRRLCSTVNFSYKKYFFLDGSRQLLVYIPIIHRDFRISHSSPPLIFLQYSEMLGTFKNALAYHQYRQSIGNSQTLLVMIAERLKET